MDSWTVALRTNFETERWSRERNCLKVGFQLFFLFFIFFFLGMYCFSEWLLYMCKWGEFYATLVEMVFWSGYNRCERSGELSIATLPFLDGRMETPLAWKCCWACLLNYYWWYFRMLATHVCRHHNILICHNSWRTAICGHYSIPQRVYDTMLAGFSFAESKSTMHQPKFPQSKFHQHG